MGNFILVKPGLHIVVTIVQTACDCVLLCFFLPDLGGGSSRPPQRFSSITFDKDFKTNF